MSTAVLPHTVEPHPVTGMYNGKFGIWLFLASEVMLFGGLFSAYVLLRVGDSHWPHGRAAGLNTWIGMTNTLVLITSSVTMVMAWASLKMNNLARGRMFLAITALLALLFLVIKIEFEYIPKFHHYGIWLNNSTAPITGHIEDESALDNPEVDEIVFHPDPVQAYTSKMAPAAEGGQGAESAAAGHEAAEHAEGEHAEMHIAKKDITRYSAFTPAFSNFFAIYYTITGLHGLHVLGGILVIVYLLLPGSKMWKSEQERFTNRIECTGLYWHFVDLVWIFLFPTFYLL